MQGNACFTIRPYKHAGVWVFDDDSTGLVREPFVSGAEEIIEHFMADVPGAICGFNLAFSASAFPGHNGQLVWVRPEAGGNWYRLEGSGREGWLAPALLKYFTKPPARLYVKFG